MLADSPVPRRARPRGLDRVEQWWARVYERAGSRILWLAIAVNLTSLVPACAICFLVVVEYLGISSSGLLGLFAIWAPITAVIAIGGLLLSASQLRTILSWSGDRRTSARAPEVWTAIVHIPTAVARCMLVGSVGLAGFLLHLVVRFHEPGWLIAPFLVADAGFVASLWVLHSFTMLLLMRPMLADVATYLPSDFEPPGRGLGLRARVLAPLPLISLFGAFVVGAFANVVADGAPRYAISMAITLPCALVATLIFLIVARSVLDPIEELIATTERVRSGDMTRPARLLSDDELGALGTSFNTMLRDLAQREEDLRASRERIVAAADAERRRVERDLHDGAQQHLVLLNLKLAMAQRLIDTDPAGAKAMHDELRIDLERALAELRDLAHGIYPQVLESEGLPAALREAARRSPIPATVEVDGTIRYRPELEAAVYFCCLEALQNAGKHAGEGTTATIRLADRDGTMHFEVVDTGAGFDPSPARASAGMQNMTDRIGALGGTLTVHSAAGAGTRIEGTIPLS
jgi:signal transduction histidine kinase